MIEIELSHDLRKILGRLSDTPPEAYAIVRGNSVYPDIWGVVYFYPCWGGSLVLAEIQALPYDSDSHANHIHGFHIHDGSNCSGTLENPFSGAGQHWNPDENSHPSHAGDLPPLFGSCGYALSIFYTRRFVPDEVIGHTIIIHAMTDDFKTQPSGDAGEKIACGEIRANEQASYFPALEDMR